MKPATNLKALAASMKPAPGPAEPEPPRVVSYRVAETRAETRQLSGHFPGTDVQSDFPCPPSFDAQGDGGQAWFCTLEKGSPGFTDFPVGATAACDQASEGIFGFKWPA